MVRLLVLSSSLAVVVAQQPGSVGVEEHPACPMEICTVAGGCQQEQTTVTLDANWRWTHNVGGYDSCSVDGTWDPQYCPDEVTCSQNCEIEGNDLDGYASNYGVTSTGDGVMLKYVPGSRLYLLDSETSYKMFKLTNREFSVDIDMSTLPCGTNGALYFIEMETDGGMASSNGRNNAGAKFGSGYCDAQCPQDIHFIDGYANIDGSYGACCAEMDIMEANGQAAAYTTHACNFEGYERKKCDGDICEGDVCDQPGCDFNAYRLGKRGFYGKGPGFDVDTSKPFTVVTQFITADGTDEGDLVEIRRSYWQDGNFIPNAKSTVGPEEYDSIMDKTCDEQIAAFDEVNDFKAKGSLKNMGDALRRGMVLSLSIWDDGEEHMQWLDGTKGTGPGSVRGPCPADGGDPEETRANNPHAFVKFSNIKFGEIGSTASVPAPTTVQPSSDCTAEGQDPYHTGSHIDCCAGFQEQVKDWDNSGHWYYKCVSGLEHEALV